VADLPFTDTHVHFWDLRESELRYAWLEPDWMHPVLGDHGAIKSVRYWADDFISETRQANVERVVHVQAAIGSEDPVSETSWLQQFTDRTGVPHGIVAYVDLGGDEVERTVERHAQFDALRGIRDLRYDDYLTDERWRQGYAALAGRGLVFCDDPLLEVMDDAVALAARFPQITYCVDHAGWPRERGEEYFKAWRTKMRALAARPNTVVKISGLGMSDRAWTVASLRPWVLECIDAWGTERAFFGTNWPVDRLFSSYSELIDAYAAIIADFTLAERMALFNANANRIFRL
jgi:predicted TIM-barrel fold metal-dependent hydrolase